MSRVGIVVRDNRVIAVLLPAPLAPAHLRVARAIWPELPSYPHVAERWGLAAAWCAPWYAKAAPAEPPGAWWFRLGAIDPVPLSSIPTQSEPLSVADAVKVVTGLVSQEYRLDTADVLGPHRDGDLIEPRFLSMYLCRHISGAKAKCLAPHFRRSHYMISYAAHWVRVQMSIRPDFSARVHRLAGACMRSTTGGVRV